MKILKINVSVYINHISRLALCHLKSLKLLKKDWREPLLLGQKPRSLVQVRKLLLRRSQLQVRRSKRMVRRRKLQVRRSQLLVRMSQLLVRMSQLLVRKSLLFWFGQERFWRRGPKNTWSFCSFASIDESRLAHEGAKGSQGRLRRLDLIALSQVYLMQQKH